MFLRVDSAVLAGLPRLVPVVIELRRRALTSLGIAVCAALFALAGWLLDQPLDLRRCLIGLAAAGPLSLVGAAILARARLRAGRVSTPPPGMAVYETTADGRDRHMKVVMLAILAVVSLLALDRFSAGMGTMAGLITGLCGAVGIVDLVEARGWERLVREQRSRIYVLLPGAALIAGFGAWRAYQLPADGSPDEQGVPRIGRAGS